MYFPSDMKKSFMFVLTIAILLVGTVGCASGGVSIPPEDQPITENTVPTVSVTGEGKLDLTPDMATINVGAESRASSATEATAQNNETIQKIIEKMKSLGVEEKDILTSNYNIYEYETYDNKGNPKGTEFVASTMLEIKLYDMGKVGQALDDAIAAGANQSYGIYFGLADPDAHYQEVIALALEDAKKKAETIAGGLGKKLGGAVVVSEGSYSLPDPIYREPSATDTPSETGSATEANSMVMPGTMEISTVVSVRYAMQ